MYISAAEKNGLWLAINRKERAHFESLDRASRVFQVRRTSHKGMDLE